jgi:hypothetical protein
MNGGFSARRSAGYVVLVTRVDSSNRRALGSDVVYDTRPC